MKLPRWRRQHEELSMPKFPINLIETFLQDVPEHDLKSTVKFIEMLTKTTPTKRFTHEINPKNDKAKDIALVRICYALAPFPVNDITYILNLCGNTHQKKETKIARFQP